ncbi:MutS-related protein [Clostridium luticellarii]|jgi:DNA mismatch repair ATPase MutS|uniref:DNA mismatch repair protein MutS n=4 Tax=Clostridium luticellarii TaxID=1691940 RepID=A0A2T0BEI1_9CLOT|nr:DNA mismatch repair protein MutS [Clostridium luticellarii]MCI1995790.1 DNA mismatch repair protein MutS [Clostridium luticellarii]PRR82274.1 DNA mismatch repair protein MutS [Clostridium luticellarii]
MTAIIVYILLIIVVSILFSAYSNFKADNEIKDRIENDWGREKSEKYNDGDMKTVAEYFNNKRKRENDSFFIDEITWNDLSMDDVFKSINTTESSPGEQYLYNMLREPLYNDQELGNRDRLIKFFQYNQVERKKIQYILARLGKDRNCFISDYFYKKEDRRKSKLGYYRMMAGTPILGIVLLFFNPYMALIVILISFGVNIYEYYSEKKKIVHKFEAFMYILRIAKYAGMILKEQVEELQCYNEKLRDALKGIRSIKNAAFTQGGGATDSGVLTEYLGMFFLVELINYEKMSDMLVEKSSEFETIFEVVGIIDSCISIASYRDRIHSYVTPELKRCSKKQEQVSIFKELRHPLIENSIPNSIEIDNSILITGSNASGKSTFLKTVAINIILAQTIYTCLASEFKCCYFRIYTSMALKDDIFNNESYYIVETKSLKRIIDGVDDSIPTICFVDEILRGTNTVERIAASSQVLKYLTLSNCICVAATHDIELTYILEKYFSNYHFQEEIVDNNISFDYKIHGGRAQTQNAIKLLGILGYSDEIVGKAQEKASSFLKDGVWQIE